LVLDPAVHIDQLNQLVVATGSDGYRVVYSLGELSPTFGARPSIVAYAETIGGVSQGLGDDGFARTTAPGDLRGGRYVSNLVSLDVRPGRHLGIQASSRNDRSAPASVMKRRGGRVRRARGTRRSCRPRAAWP
jgi:hypothetical protein